MAWSDEIRCLHCDGKLPLYRKITSGQFCSAVHRKAYWQEQERLAVERLHQTHDSLRAYRPPGALEAILGKPAASEPVSLDRYYLPDQVPEPVGATAEEIARSASNTGKVAFAAFLTEDKPGLRAWAALLAAWDVEFAHWPMSSPAQPSHAAERKELTLQAADCVTLPLTAEAGAWWKVSGEAQHSAPVDFIAKFVPNVAFTSAPETDELDPTIAPAEGVAARSIEIPLFHAVRGAAELLFAGEAPGTVEFIPKFVTSNTPPGQPSCRLEAAPGVAIALFPAIEPAADIQSAAEQAVPAEFVARFAAQVPLAMGPQTQELNRAFLESAIAAENAARQPEPQAVEETSLPIADRLIALPKIAAQSASSGFRATEPEAQPAMGRAQHRRLDAALLAPVLVAGTELEPLAMTNAPCTRAARAGASGDTQPGDLSAYSQPMELPASTAAPQMDSSIPAAAPELLLASGSGGAILGERKASLQTGSANLPSPMALALGHQTAGSTKQLAEQLVSQALGLSLSLAPGRRYDVKSRQGENAVQGGGAVTELSVVLSPSRELAIESPELIPSFAAPCSYPVRSTAGGILPIGAAEPLLSAGGVQIASLPDNLGAQETSPVQAKIRPLAFTGTPCAPPRPQPVAAGVAHLYASNAPLHPNAKWEPRDGSATPPLRQGFLAGWTSSFTSADDRKHVWAHAADFWQHAPRDLKLLSIAIPILLGLALRPSLPKVRVSAPASTEGISRNIGDGFRRQFINVRNSVSERAAVSLNEDFRSGLDDWQARGNLSTGWSFDGNGFVRPGTLALYRPSLNLTDYQMEFLGLIDKKALSWVVRAKDFDNYYVVKLVMTKAGPLPTIGITRYAVIDGKAQAHVDRVAAINARPDMLYRVSLNVHDDTYLLALQGTIVDNWTDSRLKRGGIGFFAPRGEESRLRWVQVTHQYDMLGRLCAYLAPYNIPTTNGSW